MEPGDLSARDAERRGALLELLIRYKFDPPDLMGKTPGGTPVGRGYRYKLAGNKAKQEEILRALHIRHLQYALQMSGRDNSEIISVRRYPR